MSGKNEIVIDFDDRAAKVGFIAKLGALTGRWSIEIRKQKPKRSLKANAFYWAAVVPAFQQFMRQHGQYFEKEEVHEFFLKLFVGRPVIDPLSGEVIDTIGDRSSDMDGPQFAKYLNDCMGWMLDRYGIVVPEPEVIYQERKAG